MWHPFLYPSNSRPAQGRAVEKNQTTSHRVLTHPVGVFVLATFCGLLWGSAFPCIKIGYQLFDIPAGDTPSQLLFAGVRFFISGVMVNVAMSLVRRRPMLPRARDAKPIAVLALFQTFGQYVFFYTGLSRAAGVTSSIVESCSTFFAILLAVYVFRLEKITGRKVVGCVIGFVGVLLVSLSGSDSRLSFTLLGEGFVLVSTIAGALSSNFIRVFSADHDSVLLSGWQFMVGGAALAIVGFAGGGKLHPCGPEAIVLLAYMGFISAAAYSIWALLLSVNPVSRITVFGFCNPVFGALLSAALLGEGALISPARYVVSLALVCAGIVIVNVAPRAGREETSS